MREIEAFLAVADELHFGRAAERLLITTGRVSQAVRSLEREVGAPLFERTSRRVALTPLGASFLARVGPAYKELGAALDEARQASGMSYRTPLRVGFASTLPPDLGPRLTAAFARHVPECRIAQLETPASEMLRWLNSGQLEVDVYVGWFPGVPGAVVPGWVETGSVLMRTPRAVLVSPRSPLAGRSCVDAEELAGYTVIRPWGFAPFADAWAPSVTPGGKPIRRAQQTRVTYLEDLRDLLADGMLVHLTVASLRPFNGLIVIPLTGLPPMTCAPVWSRGTENRWIARFADIAAECAG